jgi:hypothetical protein
VPSDQPSPPAATDQQASGTIPALIAKLETQIAQGRISTPPNDNAADTFAAITALLPSASLPDLDMVAAMPARFAKRAREAEVAGRPDEARRFKAMSGSANAAMPNDAAAQQTPPLPEPEPRPATVATRSHSPALPAERSDANHPEAASTKPPPPGAAEEQAPGTIALLAKLERQIAEDHMATPPNDNAADTLQAILTLLPNAPLADSQLVAAAFSHFADRAREAEAAGRSDEAKRFATFGDHSGRAASNDGAAQAIAARNQATAVITGVTAQPKQRIESALETSAAAELTVKPVPVDSDARMAVLARLRRNAEPQEPLAAATPSPARPEPDARAAALARLRSRALARDGAKRVPSDQPPTAQPRQWLLDARTALEAGRVDEAQKLLQQAQVQLSLRPAAQDMERVAAGPMVDALSMLSVGDVPRALQYINLAAVQANESHPAAAAATAQPSPLRQ